MNDEDVRIKRGKTALLVNAKSLARRESGQYPSERSAHALNQPAVCGRR